MIYYRDKLFKSVGDLKTLERVFSFAKQKKIMTNQVDARDPASISSREHFGKPLIDVATETLEVGIRANVILAQDGVTVKEIVGPITYNVINKG